jgi:hypothetical protein
MAKESGGKWPIKNPETGMFPMMTTPLSTNAASADSNIGAVGQGGFPDSPTAANPMGFTAVGEGKSKKGRK